MPELMKNVVCAEMCMIETCEEFAVETYCYYDKIQEQAFRFVLLKISNKQMKLLK